MGNKLTENAFDAGMADALNRLENKNNSNIITPNKDVAERLGVNERNIRRNRDFTKRNPATTTPKKKIMLAP